MVFKRYIKRGGKVFGPYFYKSKRVKGKIKSIYVGSKKNKELVKKHEQQKTSSPTHPKKPKHKPKKKPVQKTKKHLIKHKPAHKTKPKTRKKPKTTKHKSKTYPKKHITHPTRHPTNHKTHPKISKKTHQRKQKTQTKPKKPIHKPKSHSKIHKKSVHKPKKHPTKRKKKRDLTHVSSQELMNLFNLNLLKIGKAITMGELKQSIEFYDELVHIYNNIKRKVSYQTSLLLYNRIKQIYEDINTLRQEGI